MRGEVIANGKPMGCFVGKDRDAVLGAYARDAGYEDYAELVEETGADPGEAEVAAVEVVLMDRLRSVDPDRISSTSPERWMRGEQVELLDETGTARREGEFLHPYADDPARRAVVKVGD